MSVTETPIRPRRPLRSSTRRGARAFAVAAFGFAAFGLTGCGSDEATDSSPKTTAPANDKMETGVTELDPAMAAEALAADPPPFILDVRTPEEFAQGHIEGAVNIDFQGTSFDDKIAELDPSATTFVYCRSGNRSSQAVAKMQAAGFTDILHLSDGVIGWEAADQPLVNG